MSVGDKKKNPELLIPVRFPVYFHNGGEGYISVRDE